MADWISGNIVISASFETAEIRVGADVYSASCAKSAVLALRRCIQIVLIHAWTEK
jgi:hypothetical protein